MKFTNLDIIDAACLYVVHILQHPTSRPSTESTQNTVVNAPKMNISPLPAGKYGKSTMHSTRRRPQANEAKSGLDGERGRALGGFCSVRSKQKLVEGRRQETHFVCTQEKGKCIEDYVERETAVARNRVQDADTAINQAQEEMRNAENAGFTTTQPETTFEEMLDAIGDCLTHLASSNDAEDGEDEDDDKEDPEVCKVSEDDNPGWVMGTISQTVQHPMERFRQKQMKLDQLMQPGCGDAADYFRERHKKYETTELKFTAVVQSQREEDATCSVPMTFREPMETLDSIPGKSQMPQVTSRPVSSQMRLGLQTPQTHKGIPSLPPAPVPDSFMIQISKHVEYVRYNSCTQPPKHITK